MAADNKSLGRFILDGIPPAPRGVPQVEVTFDIDANGILNVSAKDKATGKEQKITITGSTGLSKDEVEKMTKEAEAHAEEDKKKKEDIETRNIAENLVYSTEKTLKDNGDKVPADVKTEVEGKMNDLKEALKGSDVADIKAKGDVLGESIQKIGAAMYQDPAKEKGEEEVGPQGDPGGPTDESHSAEASRDEAVEGEVVEESGDNKDKKD